MKIVQSLVYFVELAVHCHFGTGENVCDEDGAIGKGIWLTERGSDASSRPTLSATRNNQKSKALVIHASLILTTMDQ